MTPSEPGDALIELAGYLAERGITRLELREPGKPPRELRARETDLPAVLQVAADVASLHEPASPRRLAHREGGRWTLDPP